VIATGMIFEHQARLRSFELLAEAARGIEAPQPKAAPLTRADRRCLTCCAGTARPPRRAWT
jgi:hypothetical protein